VPPEVESAIDKRSSMSAIGNLNEYVKFQMAEGLGKGDNAASGPAQWAMGLAMAQQMGQQMAQNQPQPPVMGGAPAAAAAGFPELLSPTDAARILGVTEADVMATIQSGELKAKKIGSAYRITRAALDEFLKH
jgi:excisionase family DNA binding protein